MELHKINPSLTLQKGLGLVLIVIYEKLRI